MDEMFAALCDVTVNENECDLLDSVSILVCY